MTSAREPGSWLRHGLHRLVIGAVLALGIAILGAGVGAIWGALTNTSNSDDYFPGPGWGAFFGAILGFVFALPAGLLIAFFVWPVLKLVHERYFPRSS